MKAPLLRPMPRKEASMIRPCARLVHDWSKRLCPERIKVKRGVFFIVQLPDDGAAVIGMGTSLLAEGGNNNYKPFNKCSAL